MPIGRSTRNYHTGNARSSRRSGTIYRGAPDRVAANNTLQSTQDASDAPRRTCPTCGLDVGLRRDGSLRNHRVGTSGRNAWPCPGEDPHPTRRP